jgi:acetolactate synthase I/II/III large subunit
VPADIAWNEAAPAAPALPVASPASCRRRRDRTGRRRTAIGQAGSDSCSAGQCCAAEGLLAAGRIAKATGARLLCDTFAPRLERGAGRVVIERLPYFAEQLVETLAPFEHLLLVGSTPPVAFFAYPGKASWCSPEGCRIDVVAHAHEDGIAALEALADALDASD